MAVRVTRAITVYGRYYAVGEVLESTPVVDSLRRLYGWEVVPEPKRGLSSLSKAELLDLADDRGVEVPASATKAEIRELLES